MKDGLKDNNIVNIWPWGMYHIFVLLIAGGCILLMNIGPILLVIFSDETLEVLGYTLHKSWLLAISIPVSLIYDYLFLKAILWKVSFTKSHILAPKISEIQENKIELICKEILKCEAKGFYFIFTCSDGIKRELSIIRFSFKQMELIIQMIQERGGLIDQNINEIINPLRIRKKK